MAGPTQRIYSHYCISQDSRGGSDYSPGDYEKGAQQRDRFDDKDKDADRDFNKERSQPFSTSPPSNP